jgi:hypothetical protein
MLLLLLLLRIRPRRPLQLLAAAPALVRLAPHHHLHSCINLLHPLHGSVQREFRGSSSLLRRRHLLELPRLRQNKCTARRGRHQHGALHPLLHHPAKPFEQKLVRAFGDDGCASNAVIRVIAAARWNGSSPPASPLLLARCWIYMDVAKEDAPGEIFLLLASEAR